MSNYFELQKPKLTIGFWIATGAKIGLLAGAITANLFILLVIIYSYDSSSLSLREFLMSYILLGQIFGTLPALLIGLVSGMFTGFVFYHLQKRKQLASGSKEGFVIALGLALIVFAACIWLNQDFLVELRRRYFLLSACAILSLFLVSGIFGGRRLARHKIMSGMQLLHLHE